MAIRTSIMATGSALASKRVINKDLEKVLDTSDSWIRERSGIEQRFLAEEAELTSDLATRAAQDALKSANLDPQNLDLIIVATTTPDRTFPSTAAYVQAKLGISNCCAAFDIQAVCSGFVYALSVGDAMIKSGAYKNALIIGAETMSRILDWTDRTTAVLFGDGAGAFVLEATPGGTSNDSDLLDHLLACDGNKSELLSVDGGPSLNQSVGHLRMNGREVFRHAVSNMSHTILTVLERNSLTIEDIDWFVPHQANFRIIKAVAARVGLPIEKTVVTVGQHANTSAASIPLAMHEAVQDGRIQRGHLIMTEAMGGGFTWGGNLIRW
jgi:3-oxoacyl-[acyl-carrier-protein] synthase-3